MYLTQYYHFCFAVYKGQRGPKMDDLFLVKNKHGEKFRLSDKIMTKWETIGSRLGIEGDTLEAINSDHGRSESKLRKVFGIWMDNAGGLPNHQEYPLTWKGLKTLLEDIDKVEVANEYFKFLENVN